MLDKKRNRTFFLLELQQLGDGQQVTVYMAKTKSFLNDDSKDCFWSYGFSAQNQFK